MAKELEVGDKAPALSLPDQSGEPVSLKDFTGKQVVLYFYPKDDTPGCTIEANQFTQYAEQFAQLDTVIIGVSKDSCASHRDFISKYGLQLELLADTSGELCELYNVWREREKEGVKSMAVLRSTFIIDKKGVLADVEYGVVPDGHALAVLEKIKAL